MTKKLLNSSIAFILLLFASQTTFAATSKAGGLPGSLEQLVKNSGFKTGDVGLWVGTSDTSGLHTFYSHNADKSMIPASLSKIVTAGAVLDTIHSGFKFKTVLASDVKAKIELGVLDGPLYLKGGGDPSFVSENMWFLVNELNRTGITSVGGDIVVDDTRFDKVRFGQDRQDERVDRAYDAPVGAMSMNWNSVSVYTRPGDKVGDRLKVFVDVASPYIKIRNETKTVAAGHGKSVAVERSSEDGFAGDVITVTGSMAIGSAEAVSYKSISQPDLFAGYNLVEFLKNRGISVTGKVRVGEMPKNATVLATEESKEISGVVADMAKWSNNFVAEMLVKNLSFESGDKIGTMDGGMAHVRAYLESVGLKKGEYEFINAAGFTRRNRLSPQQLGTILEHVRNDFSLFPEYANALPIAGVDGTLRKRMKDSSAAHWVRAKTGLLNGVVGLAGFAGRRDGTVTTFAFIYNGSGREDKARALFDHLTEKIAED